ncbi:MAG: hypothetical protein IPM06_21160 [Rhizobiales bacterium]|nr:hypothetical protein [Hyphomicrobiales bacterium]
MREPSTIAMLYGWWRAALNNADQPRSDGFPECGFYKRRMVKGGPWVAARIWCEREIDASGELTGPECLRCEIDGTYADPCQHWTYLTPISREDYEALLRRRLLLDGMMTPEQPIDLSRRPIWTP